MRAEVVEASAPSIVADLPEGETSDVPWYDKGRLHVGEAAIRTRPLELRYANGTIVAGRSRMDGSEWFLVLQTAQGARMHRLVRSKGPTSVTVSADGATVVWVETLGEDLRRVTAYDVGSRRRLGSVRVPVHTFCCTGNGEVYVTSILRDGRVVWHTADRRPAVVWRPGDRGTVRLRGHRSRALTMGGWPGGVMWQARGRDIFYTPGVYASVGRDGVAHRQGRVPVEQRGGWSPDGRTFVYVGQEDGRSRHKEAAHALWAKNVATGQLLRLGLATDSSPNLIGWESPTEVLVWVSAGDDPDAGDSRVPQALVRCEVSTGACERPAEPPSRLVNYPIW
ncbi:hypothetical protein [Nocardioides sp. 616]|uniref:hypothetical protein n=1 Tax=Nocardioides sp. 616 TaxID=2268090 RepID=UPI0013B3FECA|nr:hypothetical protein [Nocardioides sp. 616]